MARLTFQPLALVLAVILLASTDLLYCTQAPPNCTVDFREDGQLALVHNITKLDSNTYVVSFNATKPQRLWKTDDGAHFSKIFGDNDQLPPYLRFYCSTPYPTNFEFEGVGALDFLRIYKRRQGTRKPCRDGMQPGNLTNPNCSLYYTSAEVLLSPQATGKYIFYSVAFPNVSTSYFVFAEAKSKPFLLGASSTRSHALEPKLISGANNTVNVILPCVASNYNVTVNLYRKFEPQVRGLKDTWLKIHPRTIRFDPKRGFIGTLKPQSRGSDFMKLLPGIYKCSTGTESDPDSVILEVPSDLTAEKPQNKSADLSIRFVNKTAICESAKPGNTSGDLEISNMFAQNPTESRLLAECVMKGNSYCGTSSIHQRKFTDISLPGVESDCVQPFCAQIQNVYEFGLVACSRGSSHVLAHYFTGLDGVIYTELKSAPLEAFLRPKLREYMYEFYTNGTRAPNLFVPGVLQVRTGIPYYVHCEADWLLFVKDPLTVSIKYRNGSVIKLFEPTWADPMRRLYLSTDMVGIICADDLWETNEEIKSTLNIKVEDADCELHQFKCSSNGQCISLDEACNKRVDCPDGSDETSATCQKFTPKIATGPSQVIFIANTRGELICELLQELPMQMHPTVEWQYKGKIIVDHDRLWRDVTRRKLLLQFANVSLADEGEYLCKASNTLGSAEYKVTVRVRPQAVQPTPDSTPRTMTVQPESRSEVQKTSNSGSLSEVHEPPHFSSEPNYEEHEGSTSAGFIAGVTIIVLVVLVAAVAGGVVGWKTRCIGLRVRWPRDRSSAGPRIRIRAGESESEQIGAGNVYHAF